MDLDNERESSNIEDQRGQGGGLGFGGGGFGGGGGGLGILGLILAARGLGIGIPGLIVIAIGYFLLFGNGGGGGGGSHLPLAPTTGSSAVGFQPGQDAAAPATSGGESQTDRFVRKVLATTEDTWGRIFQANGQTYPQPKLVLYSGEGSTSGCGEAQSAMGPFYCPGDRKVYLDESFFDELSSRFGVAGQFADAYVIAHEIGHHVQNVTGEMERAKRMGLPQEGANGSQVRIELQADCYAGVWGNANKAILAPGDVDQALRAANAIGDDTLQRSAGRSVTPDSFTHGTSAQRMRWFKRGYDGGNVQACDTYSGAI